MERLTEFVEGRLCVIGMRPENEDEKLIDVVKRLSEYEEMGKDPVELKAICAADPDEQCRSMQKVFALACRVMADMAGCPATIGVVEWAGWPECNGEMDECGDRPLWECWQKYLKERIEEEPVCRVCGCTQENACPGGCFWHEEDLCSKCAEVDTK